MAAKYSFDTIAADNESATKTLQDAGVEFDMEPDVQSFKDALGGTAYYERYANETWFNQDLLDTISRTNLDERNNGRLAGQPAQPPATRG